MMLGQQIVVERAPIHSFTSMTIQFDDAHSRIPGLFVKHETLRLTVGTTHLLVRRQRVVLMHNSPSTIDLSQTHGQSKFQLFPFTG